MIRYLKISTLFCLVFLIAPQFASAQKPVHQKGFIYPVIKKQGQEIKDFSIPNWVITDTIAGDLNKDKGPDLALVLSCKDSVKIANGYKYPRILLLLLKVGDHYELKIQHNTLMGYEILANSGNTGNWDGDPLESIEIINGVLKFHFKSDAGGVGTSIQLIVRYQSNDFYLIGATVSINYRADTKIVDYNFSTGRYAIDEEDDESGFGGNLKKIHKKGKLPVSGLKRLIDIKDSNSWDIYNF